MKLAKYLKKILGIAMWATFASGVMAQTFCTVKVLQDEQEIQLTREGGWPTYKLQAAPFTIEVAPASCAPSIATIPNLDIVRKLVATPLIYYGRIGSLMAASESDKDRLIWWARTEFDASFTEPPSKDTFLGKQYEQLCQELKFCPTVYPLYSSTWPFTKTLTGDKSIAQFKRGDDTLSISQLSDKSVPTVIYTLWRSLPSQYPMAEPEQLLFRPLFLNLIFSKP
jgi:hypothetical protein